MPENYGLLSVSTVIADSVPIPGATVRIIGAEEINRDKVFSLTTDRDGITEAIRLPAPPASLTLSPEPVEAPYSLYDIEVTREGFYPRKFSGVRVFSGIRTLQIINMIPALSGDFGVPIGSVGGIIPNRPE